MPKNSDHHSFWITQSDEKSFEVQLKFPLHQKGYLLTQPLHASQEIIKETKTTTILVTHDIRDTFNISDKILIFKAGVLQQYDNPESMYCNPINCYCAKILGDLNQITIDNKTYYLRPEKIKLSDDSKFEGVVEKSLFAGKEYKVSVNVNNENWIFFNDSPLEKNKKIKLDFDNEDLLEFDSTCSNFFTS